MLDSAAFSYDQTAPINLRVLAERGQDGALVQDIRFDSPRGGDIPAYLIFPAQGAVGASVLFGHWGEGDREQFVEEASVLADTGLASLCLDAPFRRPMDHEPSLAEVPQLDAWWVVDVRRGVDLLTERFHLPAGRLGYVGHSYTATLGGAVAWSERRISALVLMAGEPALSEWMLETTHPGLVHERETTAPDEYQAYVTALAPLDARHYIGHAAPAHLFFQFARHDEYLPVERGERYHALASEPKRIAWYDSRHALNAAARRDRAIFLCDQLGLGRPSDDVLHRLEQVPAPTPIEDWNGGGPEGENTPA